MLVTAADAALHLRLAFGVNLRPATIRMWANRGHIDSTGHGRCRYDLREVERHARLRGLLGDGVDRV